MNPYWNLTFLQALFLFFRRCGSLCIGNLPLSSLASDEIQIFVMATLACGSALIGVLLILKKMTMLANALSHTLLVGIVIAYFCLFSSPMTSLELPWNLLLLAALVTALVTALLTEGLRHFIKLQEDASIGLVFTTLFALGVIMVSLYTRNAHIGLEVVMGSVDALHLHDLKISAFVCGLNLLSVIAFFKEWRLVCFDSGLAANLGKRPALFHYFLMLLTSITAIGAFRAVGVLLFLSFLVIPPLTARLLTHSLRNIFFFSVGIGVGISIIAVALGRHLLTIYDLPLSTAGLAVTLLGLCFFCTLCIKACIQQRIKRSLNSASSYLKK